MHTVTHLDQVRAGIRTAWPPEVVCPPHVVRWRAGSDRAGWDTLVELARVRAQHPADATVERLVRGVSRELVAQHHDPAAVETTRHLIAVTLGLVGTANASNPAMLDAYRSGAA